MCANVSIEVSDDLIDHLSALGQLDLKRQDAANIERFIYEAIQIGTIVKRGIASIEQPFPNGGHYWNTQEHEILDEVRRSVGPAPLSARDIAYKKHLADYQKFIALLQPPVEAKRKRRVKHSLADVLTQKKRRKDYL
jgi:hypothetical protein